MKPYVLTVTLNPALDKTVSINKLVPGGLNRVVSSRVDPGGKGINVAKVLKNFGLEVIAAGLIAGAQGELLLEKLDLMGIRSGFRKIPGETRTNLKIVEEASNITTEINEPGFTVSPEALENFKDSLSSRLDNSSFLVLSGSLPQGVPVGIYRELISLAKAKGVRTVLDADGAALANGIKALPYAVKPNIFELEMLTGKKMLTVPDIVAAAKPLVARGIELIVVSMGAEGCVVLDRKTAYRARPYPITPGSTVGAGDSMVAALVYSILNCHTLEATARWVTAAGTVTASKPGTQVCSLDEVIQHIGSIGTERVELTAGSC